LKLRPPLAEETHNPKHNIPRAVIYSAIAIGLLYTIASFAGVNGWGIPSIQGYVASAAPWADLGKKYWGVVGPIIVTFAIINSAVGNGNAGINATSRVAYAMGRIGTLATVICATLISSDAKFCHNHSFRSVAHCFHKFGPHLRICRRLWIDWHSAHPGAAASLHCLLHKHLLFLLASA